MNKDLREVALQLKELSKKEQTEYVFKIAEVERVHRFFITLQNVLFNYNATEDKNIFKEDGVYLYNKQIREIFEKAGRDWEHYQKKFNKVEEAWGRDILAVWNMLDAPNRKLLMQWYNDEFKDLTRERDSRGQ